MLFMLFMLFKLVKLPLITSFTILLINSHFVINTKEKPDYFFLSGFSFPNIHDSQDSNQKGKGKAISLIRLYHLPPPHRQLDIIRAITGGSSPQPDTNREPLVSKFKSLTTKLRALKSARVFFGFQCCHLNKDITSPSTSICNIISRIQLTLMSKIWLNLSDLLMSTKPVSIWYISTNVKNVHSWIWKVLFPICKKNVRKMKVFLIFGKNLTLLLPMRRIAINVLFFINYRPVQILTICRICTICTICTIFE